MPDQTHQINSELIDKISQSSEVRFEDLSLETMVFLLNTERLNRLNDRSDRELLELKNRQDQVSTLNRVLKKINANTDAKGDLDFSHDEELKSLLQEAKGLQVEGIMEKEKYTKQEKERLEENIKMTIGDLNIKNEMQLKAVDRLTNERYESFQIAKNILKPLHEAKMQIAKNMSK